MNQQTYAKLSILAFGLILVSFVIVGFSRIVLRYETARLLGGPTLLAGFGLVCFLFVRGLFAYTNILPLESR